MATEVLLKIISGIPLRSRCFTYNSTGSCEELPTPDNPMMIRSCILLNAMETGAVMYTLLFTGRYADVYTGPLRPEDKKKQQYAPEGIL